MKNVVPEIRSPIVVHNSVWHRTKMWENAIFCILSITAKTTKKWNDSKKPHEKYFNIIIFLKSEDQTYASFWYFKHASTHFFMPVNNDAFAELYKCKQKKPHLFIPPWISGFILKKKFYHKSFCLFKIVNVSLTNVVVQTDKNRKVLSGEYYEWLMVKTPFLIKKLLAAYMVIIVQ